MSKGLEINVSVPPRGASFLVIGLQNMNIYEYEHQCELDNRRTPRCDYYTRCYLSYPTMQTFKSNCLIHSMHMIIYYCFISS